MNKLLLPTIIVAGLWLPACGNNIEPPTTQSDATIPHDAEPEFLKKRKQHMDKASQIQRSLDDRQRQMDHQF